jgi:hypothetical protein
MKQTQILMEHHSTYLIRFEFFRAKPASFYENNEYFWNAFLNISWAMFELFE